MKHGITPPLKPVVHFLVSTFGTPDLGDEGVQAPRNSRVKSSEPKRTSQSTGGPRKPNSLLQVRPSDPQSVKAEILRDVKGHLKGTYSGSLDAVASSSLKLLSLS